MDGRPSTNRRELLAIEAADWVARGALTDRAEREKFEQWLMESPAHVREFIAAVGWNDALPADLANVRIDVDQLVSQSTNVIYVADAMPPPARSRCRGFRWARRNLIAVGTAAAAAIALVLSPIAGNFWPTNVYATSVGEQRTVALSDGSIVALNAQSRIRVAYSRQSRSVYLTAGQAMFTVSHDAKRPFRVHADGAIVQAIGTKFDVRLMTDRTSIAVIEGRVQITPRDRHSGEASLSALAERMRLAAGEGISILDDGEVTPPRLIDVADTTAWQQRRLVFVDDTLSDIIEEFQRYNRTRIRVEGDELDDLRFSGVWDADRPDLLLTYLSSHGNVRVDHEGDAFVLRPLSRPPPAQ